VRKSNQEIAEEIRRRVHDVALGDTRNVTEVERRVGARLAELWLSGEEEASARIEWRLDWPRRVFWVVIRRADGKIERIEGLSAEKLPGTVTESA
jgi:hypothetical protein